MQNDVKDELQVIRALPLDDEATGCWVYPLACQHLKIHRFVFWAEFFSLVSLPLQLTVGPVSTKIQKSALWKYSK